MEINGENNFKTNKEIHIEAVKEKSSTSKIESVKQQLLLFLQKVGTCLAPVKFTKEHFMNNLFLEKNIVSINVIYCDDSLDSGSVNFNVDNLKIHLYELHEADDVYEEEIENDNETVVAAENLLLPSKSLDLLWDSLVFDKGVKSELLSYANSALLFSDSKVSPAVVSWNKVILLHGPPGTGKTSLCRALAHKLSVRLSHRYDESHLIEINSHSLFSKWFSESGKLVAKMMRLILDYVRPTSASTPNSPSCLVFVLIDEIESLTAMRQAALSGNEPSDAIRVVNSLLTQLDKMKNYSNVFIFTTSNITEAIDAAFLDRADIRMFIGNPSPEVVYTILKSCLLELMQRRLIQPSEQFISQKALNFMQFADNKVSKSSLLLWSLSQKCCSFSGRTLRKLAFLAHSKFVRRDHVNLVDFIEALERQVHSLLVDDPTRSAPMEQAS